MPCKCPKTNWSMKNSNIFCSPSVKACPWWPESPKPNMRPPDLSTDMTARTYVGRRLRFCSRILFWDRKESTHLKTFPGRPMHISFSFCPHPSPSLVWPSHDTCFRFKVSLSLCSYRMDLRVVRESFWTLSWWVRFPTKKRYDDVANYTTQPYTQYSRFIIVYGGYYRPRVFLE